MRTIPTARHTRVLVPLITLSLVGLGLQATSSHAAPHAECATPTVWTEPGGDAGNDLLGGTIIKYTASCTGNDQITKTVLATYGGRTVFKTVASKAVQGQMLEAVEVHLPTAIQQVCVTLDPDEEGGGQEPETKCAN